MITKVQKLIPLTILILLIFDISKVLSQDRFMKGITFGGMLWPKENLQLVDYNLQRLHGIGVNSIILIVDWYVDDYRDPTIEPWYRDKPGFPNTEWFSPTLSDSEVCQIITNAHQRGMKVILKPQVETLDWPFGGIGRWGLQLNTGKWDSLFTSYLGFISHYAKLADSLNIEVFIIGCELESMTHTQIAGLINPDERWRFMISEIRKIYKGKLTYSCSFHGNLNQTWSSPNHITFWDALDYIGFEVYRGLTLDNLSPSLQQLEVGVTDVFDNFIEPLSIQFNNKKVIITEINYYSFDGVNTNPISDPAVSPFTVDNSPVDQQEQADCYTAVLQVVNDVIQYKDYLEGIFWWAGYFVNPSWNYDWVTQDKYDFIWFKPAEQVLRYFYSFLNVNDQTFGKPYTFMLYQNYPNPFNPVCIIEYTLPRGTRVVLNIYNLLGQKVRCLVDEYQTAGCKSVRWDGRNDHGVELATGVYFYAIQAGEFVQSKKMIMIK